LQKAFHREGLPTLPVVVSQGRGCPRSPGARKPTAILDTLPGVTVHPPLPHHQEWRSNFHGDSSSRNDVRLGSRALFDGLLSPVLVLPAGVLAVQRAGAVLL
jgi:hypothetical protein